jgi:adenylate kinase family enzyme
MNNNFARLLEDQIQVGHFLNTVLKIDKRKFKRIEYKIITSEKGLIDGLNFPTSTSTKYRDLDYQTHEARLRLRKQIVQELFTLSLPDNDDHIKLGKGGAVPQKLIRSRHACILIGLPASGKSTIARRFATEYGAIILDSDFAKRKLPEFPNYPWGASIVHEESAKIIFGEEEDGFSSLFAKAIEQSLNLIIPKIGADTSDIIEFAELLKRLNYKVHLTLVYLPKEKATIRALKRFKETNRYVPLSLIFDVYSENPTLTYFLLKDKKPNLFESFGVISTDVPVGTTPVCTDARGKNPAMIYPVNTILLN